MDDLDALLGYEPETHSLKGLPALAKPSALQPSPKELASSPTRIPSVNPQPDAQAPGQMPSVMPTVGTASPTAGIPAIDAGTSQPPKPQQSLWQKLGHGAEKGAETAGNILVPNVMADIPGTKLNKEREAGREAKLGGEQAETELKGAQADQAREGGQMVPFTDQSGQTTQVPLAKWGPLEIERERADALQKSTETKGQTAKDVAAANITGKENLAAGQNTSRETVAGENVAARSTEAEANRENQMKIAQMRDHLEDIISGRHESTQRDIASQEYGTPDKDLGAAPAGKKEGASGTLPDGTKVTVKGGRLVAPGTAGTRGGTAGGKLTAANQGRAEFAKTVVDQIPAINSEIDSLADQIGPGAGRWNQFWVNKGGVNDPAFAGLDQDLGLYASAVAVTHFGARGGGQHFIEALKKDFSQAQSPEDLKARIGSADKWLTGYANMGQKK